MDALHSAGYVPRTTGEKGHRPVTAVTQCGSGPLIRAPAERNRYRACPGGAGGLPAGGLGDWGAVKAPSTEEEGPSGLGRPDRRQREGGRPPGLQGQHSLHLWELRAHTRARECPADSGGPWRSREGLVCQVKPLGHYLQRMPPPELPEQGSDRHQTTSWLGKGEPDVSETEPGPHAELSIGVDLGALWKIQDRP